MSAFPAAEAEKKQPPSTRNRSLRNPQGLNEILSEILGRPVEGNWDEDLPSECYIGRRSKEQLRGTTSQA
jgi:hypothetical protein